MEQTLDTVNRKAKPKKKVDLFEKRIHEVDFLRGLMMFLVLMDHFFWNLKHYGEIWWIASGETNQFFYGLYYVFNFYWTNLARTIVREVVLFVFVFISGVSGAFSKNNWKRAGEMLLAFMILSVSTNLLESWQVLGQGARIDFNIIGVLAWSTLIYCFVQDKSWKAQLALALSCLVFNILIIPMLQSHSNWQNAYVPILWNPGNQADYMPLFPYVTFFFFGAMAGKILYANRESLVPQWKREFERPICFVGRHCFIFYMVHQLILVPVFLLIDLIVRGLFI